LRNDHLWQHLFGQCYESCQTGMDEIMKHFL